ncbi:MAG TPA: transposase [Desulfomonilaceae bacterium]|nr:transposase [Desulfomonilaceae bacterium]
MKYDPDRYHRRSIRLKDYDYSWTGAYFVTICVYERRCLFGGVEQGEMRLNPPGMMVANIWQDLNRRFPGVKTDARVVMPNHVHGIIWLVGAPLVGALDEGIRATTRVGNHKGCPFTVGDVIGAFKSITADEYIDEVKRNDWPPFSGRVWQRNYHEHVIHNAGALQAIRDYIEANPSQWATDPENPERNR